MPTVEPLVQDKLDLQRTFWARENHRPVIGFTGTYFHADSVRLLGKQEGLLRPEDIDVEQVVDHIDVEFEDWKDATGDLFWCASPFQQFFGWLSAVMGGPLQVKADMIWCERFIDDYGTLRDGKDVGWAALLWELLDALVERSSGRYPVAPKGVLSPLATLAEARGNTELAFDLTDRPHEVETAMSTITDAWVRLALGNFDHLPDWYGGYTSAPRFIWAPGSMIEFDEDPAFMFSPRAHGRFVMPSHRELMRHFDYPYIHLHSTQIHTLDNLLDLEELAAIELTPDFGESILDLIPAIAKIVERKPIIFHGFMTADEMRAILDRVPPEGLSIISRVEVVEDAFRLQDDLAR